MHRGMDTAQAMVLLTEPFLGPNSLSNLPVNFPTAAGSAARGSQSLQGDPCGPQGGPSSYVSCPHVFSRSEPWVTDRGHVGDRVQEDAVTPVTVIPLGRPQCRYW